MKATLQTNGMPTVFCCNQYIISDGNSVLILVCARLRYFAGKIGREDIDLLLCCGYLVEEIEEMLYHPGDFEQALAKILDECAYDYCGEF